VDNQEQAEGTLQQGVNLPGSTDTTGVEFGDDLLAELVGKPVVKAEAEPQDGSPPATPNLNDQWTAAGGVLDDLYKGTVDLSGDMGTATIQELKDDATAYRKGQAQLAEFTDEKTEFANEKLRNMQELQAVVAAIPKEHISEQLKQQLGAYQAAHQEQQERILLQAIPSWADQAVKAKDAQTMVALAAQYGLPAAALDAMTEAGWLKLVYDYAQLKQRIAGIKDKRKEPKAKGSTVTASVSTTQADGVKAALNSGDQLGAIAKLLGG